MPRKPKFTKEEVIAAAYSITRQSGIDAVTARAIAQKMGYAPSSLFTHFNNVDEIRHEVYEQAKRTFADQITDCMNYMHAFKKFGLLWVDFAKKEPNLYQLLFSGERFQTSESFSKEYSTVFGTIHQEVVRYFSISDEDAFRLINHSIIYINGLSWFIIKGIGDNTSEDVIGQNLSDFCLGLISLYKMRCNDLSPEDSRRIVDAVNIMPVKKDNT